MNQNQTPSSGKRNETLMIWLKLAFVVVIVGFILAVFISSFIMKRPDYSESENRKLAEKPAFSLHGLLNGDYFSGLSAHYNDTVPMREDLKLMGDRVLNYQGYTSDEIYIYNPGVGQKEPVDPEDPATPAVPSTPDPSYTGEPTTPLPATPTPTPHREEPPAEDVEVQPNGLVMYQKRGMELFGYTNSTLDSYTAALKNVQQKTPGITIWSMNIPHSSEFYLPEKYKSGSASQKRASEYIRNHLPSGVRYVDVYTILSQHTDEAIFLRTDVHWSYLGAYYASLQFMRDAGVPTPDLSTYTKKSKSGFLGSFYSVYKMTQLAKYPEEFTWWVPNSEFTADYYNQSKTTLTTQSLISTTKTVYFNEAKPSYAMVIGGDSYTVHLKTGVKNGRRVAVFKNSFGDALAPYLLAGFEDVWVMDLRYFKVDVYQFLQEQGITDILFAGGLNYVAYNMHKHMNNIFY